MFAFAGGATYLTLLLSGAGWLPSFLPAGASIPLEALERCVDAALVTQFQVSPPPSISQTQIRVPTAGGTGFHDTHPLYGASVSSAARYHSELPKDPVPPPLISSMGVARMAVRGSMYWGW
jgi:hypothetical protein